MKKTCTSLGSKATVIRSASQLLKSTDMIAVKRVLVYKRTHEGDPDPKEGCFGRSDCMGEVRGREYDAVIGVGGIGAEPRRNGIAEQITWIGIGPHKRDVGRRGPEVRFDHFIYFRDNRPDFMALAPRLASWMYGSNARSPMVDPACAQWPEVLAILQLAVKAPPSRGINSAGAGPAEDAISACNTRRSTAARCGTRPSPARARRGICRPFDS